MSTSETTETSGGADGDGGEPDIFKRIKEAVDELYDNRDYYHPPNPLDKLSKIEALTNAALDLLESIPIGVRKSKVHYITHEYLLGKILNATPQYSFEAESHIDKAISLNSSLADAWLSSANCSWKRKCTREAEIALKLAYKRGKSVQTLCQLSMLQREIAQELEGDLERVYESVKYAKEAVKMSPKDGYAWYNLGNAHMYSFSMSGASNLRSLNASLKAYINANKDVKMKNSPDLPFNLATAHRLSENYEIALKGFEEIASRDPWRYATGLNAPYDIEAMVKLFDIVEQIILIQSEARRYWESFDTEKSVLINHLEAIEVRDELKKTNLADLKQGYNDKAVIVGKVICFIDTPYYTPLYYMILDSKHNIYLLIVYGLHGNDVKVDDEMRIVNPRYRHQDFTWKGKRYQFDTLSVCPQVLKENLLKEERQ